jgi:hypothetical protein
MISIPTGWIVHRTGSDSQRQPVAPFRDSSDWTYEEQWEIVQRRIAETKGTRPAAWGE